MKTVVFAADGRNVFNLHSGLTREHLNLVSKGNLYVLLPLRCKDIYSLYLPLLDRGGPPEGWSGGTGG